MAGGRAFAQGRLASRDSRDTSVARCGLGAARSTRAVFDHANTIIGHAAIVIRNATWDDQAVKIGGIGGVATRDDYRRRGVARAAVAKGIEEIHLAHNADFGLLFCEPRHAPLYQKLGWRPFEGDVLVMQPRGQVRFDVTDPYVFDLKTAPRTGVLDLCGLPW